MMKRRCLFEKTVRFLITGSVIAAVAVGFYLIGYKTAYDRVEEGSSVQAVFPQTFYAEITDISGEPVSYTHLDVYKRQPIIMALPSGLSCLRRLNP